MHIKQLGIALLVILLYSCATIIYHATRPTVVPSTRSTVAPPCRLIANDVDFPPVPAGTAVFSMVTQRELPRAYHMGFETFFRHHPNATLVVYHGQPPFPVDPRFAEHGFRIEMRPIDLPALVERVRAALPTLQAAVFDTDTWRGPVQWMMAQRAMALADFYRLALVYLEGGSWIDADGLYLRPLTLLRNALPCHQHIDPNAPSVLACAALPGDGSVLPSAVYCTNGILGNWAPRHAFLAAALLRIAGAWDRASNNVKWNYSSVALGGHLFIDTLVHGNLPPDDWPNLYPLERLYGAWVGDHALVEQLGAGASEAAQLRNLEERRAFSMQLYSYVALSRAAMGAAFAPGTLLRALWYRNCVFSCHEQLW